MAFWSYVHRRGLHKFQDVHFCSPSLWVSVTLRRIRVCVEGNLQAFPLGYSMVWSLQVCIHTNGYNLLKPEYKYVPQRAHVCLFLGCFSYFGEAVGLLRGELCPDWQRLVTIQSPVLLVCRLILWGMQDSIFTWRWKWTESPQNPEPKRSAPCLVSVQYFSH